MAPNDKPWVKALLQFPGLTFRIEGDTPLFTRRLNSVYLKLFSNSALRTNNTPILRCQEYVAARGDDFFRRVIELSVSNGHLKRGALYVAALNDLAQNSDESWNDDVPHDSVVLVMDIIVQARVQHLYAKSADDQEPPRTIDDFMSTLDEWIAVLDADKQKAAPASDEPSGGKEITLPHRPNPANATTSHDAPSAGNRYPLPYRPNPTKASESVEPKHAKTSQESRAMEEAQKTIAELRGQLQAVSIGSSGDKRRIKQMEAKILELESTVQDERASKEAVMASKESLETAHEVICDELKEAKNARRRIW